MPRVYKRPAARRDLIEHYVYLAENGGEETADRFLGQAEATFKVLAEQREIGMVLTLRHAQLTGLRKWRVEDFERVLIFCLPRHDGVSIVRVMHAAQELTSQIFSSTCFTPTFWPAKAWLRLIFSAPMQILPQRVTVMVRSWKGYSSSGRPW